MIAWFVVNFRMVHFATLVLLVNTTTFLQVFAKLVNFHVQYAQVLLHSATPVRQHTRIHQELASATILLRCSTQVRPSAAYLVPP